MSLRGVVVPQSDSLLRAPEAKPKTTLTFLNTANHKPPAVSRFLITSSCLFKATLLCHNTTLWIILQCSLQLHDRNGALNRDRKGLKAKQDNATVCWSLRSPGTVWESSAFWSRTQGPIRVEEEIKRGVGASTYWKHGQPTASTTAFFWSWLCFVALLKFHK